jgi:hypothetical protein
VTPYQAEQLADLVEREAKLATAPDEGQALKVVSVINALPPIGARRSRNEADLLVIPNGLDVDASRGGQCSDG